MSHPFPPSATGSDRRLKHDLIRIARLPNGLQLYSWRYLGTGQRFIGLIAQDLLADRRFAGAVLRGADGLLSIDYAQTGYVPADPEQMQAAAREAARHWRSANGDHRDTA